MHKLKIIHQQKKELLNVTEAALKLGVSPRTLRNWQHEGKIPYIKLFGAVRFSSLDLDKLINRFRTQRGIAE